MTRVKGDRTQAGGLVCVLSDEGGYTEDVWKEIVVKRSEGHEYLHIHSFSSRTLTIVFC